MKTRKAEKAGKERRRKPESSEVGAFSFRRDLSLPAQFLAFGAGHLPKSGKCRAGTR
ncbi:hypothetical protein [Terribacillus sp. 7520-G]|uniref:hypothetical protein n=1 Tax=Terribacillus TaxID=459532 RepID=UPI0013044D91|nr:hypothetical protein [Terribacillus sp. 7520-G]